MQKPPPDSFSPVWLAAHPKSGSTWLRFLLHHLRFGAPEGSADVNRRMPSIHDDDATSWRGALVEGGVVLTHKTWGAHRKRLPAGDGVVLLVRHPADAVVSDARFFALTQLDGYLAKNGIPQGDCGPEHVDHLVSLYLTNLLQTGSVPKQRRLGFGSWGEHAGSWLAALDGRPRVVLRYEDLQRAPHAELGRVCAFLGLTVPPARVDSAVRGSDLAAMRALQEREIAAREPGRFYEARHQSAYAAGLRFVDHGKAGRGRRLPPVARERLVALWGPVMERLGYRVDGDVAAVDPLPADLVRVHPLPRGLRTAPVA
jgi:aryl sulfotransferase